MLLLTAVTLASTATWMSSRAASTRGAVGMSYLIAFTLGFLTFVGLGAEMLLYSNLGNRDPFGRGGREVFSILPNPYFALVDAVQHPLDQTALTSDTPYLPFEYLLRLRQGVNPDSVAPAIIGGVAANNAAGRDLPRSPLWVYNVVIYLGLTAFALRRASINVRAPRRRFESQNGPKAPMTDTAIDLLIRGARRRIWLSRTVLLATAAIGVAATMLAMLAAAAHLWVLPWAAPAGLVIVGGCLAAWLVVTFMVRPGLRETAHMVDRLLEGFDRVTTAYA